LCSLYPLAPPLLTKCPAISNFRKLDFPFWLTTLTTEHLRTSRSDNFHFPFISQKDYPWQYIARLNFLLFKMRKPLPWLLFFISVTSAELSSLNGKHQVIGLQLLVSSNQQLPIVPIRFIVIIVCFIVKVHEFNLRLTRNASGYIVEIGSVAADALDALSKHLNFT
jgi:hypothetical protein